MGSRLREVCSFTLLSMHAEGYFSCIGFKHKTYPNISPQTPGQEPHEAQPVQRTHSRERGGQGDPTVPTVLTLNNFNDIMRRHWKVDSEISGETVEAIRLPIHAQRASEILEGIFARLYQ